MKPFLMTLALATLALTACVTDEDPYTKIKIVDANVVVGCKLVGNLSSSSDNYGLFNETANEKRLKLIKRSAYNMSATHIVLGASVENGNTTTTEGKAYICQY